MNRSSGAQTPTIGGKGDTTTSSDKVNSSIDSSKTRPTMTTSTTTSTAASAQASASTTDSTADSKVNKTPKKNLLGAIAGGAKKAANGLKSKVCVHALCRSQHHIRL
jgi:hypothetical protein